MSEEIALAAADLATVEQLRARILEWEDTYDRLAGAFDLHMALYECEQAMSAYAAVFYDVVLAELAEQADYWRVQAQDTLVDLHAAERRYQSAVDGRAKFRTAYRQARTERDQLRRLLTAAYHALQSYARGNSAPDLAEEVARAIGKAIDHG